MTISDTHLEEVLKSLLQKNLKFNLNNKQFKKGKFILFKQNNYHIEFTIDKGDKDFKKFEVPIPFDVEQWDDDGLVYFDYRFTTLAKNDKELHRLLLSLPKDGNNKFYDKIMEIEVLDGEENEG